MENIPQDRLELALKASNEGIWDWNLVEDEGASIYYSERILDFFKTDAAHAPHLFLHPDQWIHPDELELFQRKLGEVREMNGKELFAIDCRYVGAFGDCIWLRIRGASVRNEKGQLMRLAGSMIDISHRKVAEEALAEERHQLMMLIENVPINVYFKDLDSKFVMANTATAQKLGSDSVVDILGKCDHDFFSLEHANKSLADEQKIMITGKPQNSSTEKETWEGLPDTYVITNKIPWRSRKGDLRGIIGMTQDISDVINLQNKLQKISTALAKKTEKMQLELRLAQEIQHAMIEDGQLERFPLNQQVETEASLRFAYRYSPITELAGDFYQILPLGDHQVGVFMCDVMGHGASSALIVSILRGLIEKERDVASTPEWFMYGLNQGLVAILQRAGITMFATAFYAILDCKKGTMCYANAGHPSPIVISKEKVQRLRDFQNVSGTVLGLVDECAYASATINFKQFEKIVFFTDGIYEVTNKEEEEMGVERIMQTLTPHETDIQDDLDRVLSDARHFAGDGEFSDDVCLLGLQVSHL